MSALALLTLLGGSLFAAPAPTSSRAVVVVVFDDLGVGEIGSYQIGSDPALTPTFDKLVREGVRFTRCWSAPVCSPSRAAMLTGRFGFRTGIGTVVVPQPADAPALELSETTLPEVLHSAPAGFVCGLFGKWHLGNEGNGGAASPQQAGFDRFRGNLYSLNDVAEDYSAWTKVSDGVTSLETGYNTTVLVDDAIEFLQLCATTGEDAFALVAFNAPHEPFHAPPAALLSQPLSPQPTKRELYKAMIEAADAELGRFVAALPNPAETTLIVLSDNGTPAEVAASPIAPWKAKVTLYEGGIRVPLVAWGGAVAAKGTTCDALVHVVDVFATVCELAQVDPAAVAPAGTAIDSISFAPCFAQPAQTSRRHFVYSEFFKPNGFVEHAIWGRTMRDAAGFKLIETGTPNDPFYGTGLYGLPLDPFESQNLLLVQPLPTAAATAYGRLRREIAKLLASEQPVATKK